MREFEGFVFDLDNTAVSEGSLRVGSETLLHAFHSLDSSIPVMAATGRSLEFALPITSEFGLYHESIVANGAQIIESRSGMVLEENSLSLMQVDSIIKLVATYDLDAHCCIAGDPMGSRYTAEEQIARSAPGVFVMDLDELTATALASEVAKNNQMHAYISSSVEGDRVLYDVNIGSSEAEKGKALLKLLSKKAINPMDMIVVGDSINDLSLFDVAGYRIAMADAHPTLLERADEIIPSQKENGLLEVVRRFI